MLKFNYLFKHRITYQKISFSFRNSSYDSLDTWVPLWTLPRFLASVWIATLSTRPCINWVFWTSYPTRFSMRTEKENVPIMQTHHEDRYMRSDRSWLWRIMTIYLGDVIIFSSFEFNEWIHPNLTMEVKQTCYVMFKLGVYSQRKDNASVKQLMFRGAGFYFQDSSICLSDLTDHSDNSDIILILLIVEI